MNKIDKQTLYSLVDIMDEDGTDNLEYWYYSFDDDANGWPIKMQKKRITIRIENMVEDES